jgi:hypothetical protein
MGFRAAPHRMLLHLVKSGLEYMYCLFIVEPTEGSLVFAFDQLNRIGAVCQIHRVIRMGLDMACEVESIQIDTFIMWMSWHENLRATSVRY